MIYLLVCYSYINRISHICDTLRIPESYEPGLEFHDFLQRCRNDMIVHSDRALRQLLNEMQVRCDRWVAVECVQMIVWIVLWLYLLG